MKSFENWIVDNSNLNASAAAKECISLRGMIGLFVYGKSGVGKTHLAEAVATEYKRRGYDQIKIHTTKSLLMWWNKMDPIKQIKYCKEVDLIIIDKLEELLKDHSSQCELRNIINLASACNTQLILLSLSPVSDYVEELREVMNLMWVVQIKTPGDAIKRIALQFELEKRGLVDVSEDTKTFIVENSHTLGVIRGYVSQLELQEAASREHGERLRKALKIVSVEAGEIEMYQLEGETFFLLSLKEAGEMGYRYYRIRHTDNKWEIAMISSVWKYLLSYEKNLCKLDAPQKILRLIDLDDLIMYQTEGTKGEMLATPSEADLMSLTKAIIEIQNRAYEG